MTRRHRWLAAVAGALVLVGILLPAKHFWNRICGNSRIAFYGRLIDADGHGIAGAKVTFGITFSRRPVIPLPEGRNESHSVHAVFTDADGNFELSGVYGYSVRVDRVERDGVPKGLRNSLSQRNDDPAYGVLIDDQFQRVRLPDEPKKRITYLLVDLKE